MKHSGKLLKMWLLLLVMWKCGRLDCSQPTGENVDRRRGYPQGYPQHVYRLGPVIVDLGRFSLGFPPFHAYPHSFPAILPLSYEQSSTLWTGPTQQLTFFRVMHRDDGPPNCTHVIQVLYSTYPRVIHNCVDGSLALSPRGRHSVNSIFAPWSLGRSGTLPIQIWRPAGSGSRGSTRMGARLGMRSSHVSTLSTLRQLGAGQCDY